MELLKQRILEEGRALNEHVLLVDSFLNHQVDVKLMRVCGEEFARRFADAGVTRVATIESSGIAPAAMTALTMDLPMVILKKSVSSILKDGIIQTEVFLLEQAGAQVVGVGAVIAKAFQPGMEKLRAAGYRVEALAAVTRLADGVIEF